MKDKRNKIYFTVSIFAVLLLVIPILPVEAITTQKTDRPGFVCPMKVTLEPKENTTTIVAEKTPITTITCPYNPTCTNTTHNDNCDVNNVAVNTPMPVVNTCPNNPICTNTTHNENCYSNSTTNTCPYNQNYQNATHDGTCNRTGNGRHGGGHRGNGRYH